MTVSEDCGIGFPVKDQVISIRSVILLNLILDPCPLTPTFYPHHELFLCPS